MTEEEKSAWNSGYAEGYKVGKRWAEGKVTGRRMTTTDIIIIACAVLTISINVLSVIHF